MNRQIGQAWLWLILGGEAELASVAVALVGRLAFGAPTVSEVGADLTLRLLPGAATGLLIDQLQFLAKPMLLLGIVAAQVLVGALISLPTGRWIRRDPLRGRGIKIGCAVGGLVHFLFSLLVIVSDGPLKAFAAATATSTLMSWSVLVAGSVVYALALAVLARLTLGATPGQPSQSQVGRGALTRRRALSQALGGVGVLVTGGALAQIIHGMVEQGSALPVALAPPSLGSQPPSQAPETSVIPDVATPDSAGLVPTHGVSPTAAAAPTAPPAIPADLLTSPAPSSAAITPSASLTTSPISSGRTSATVLPTPSPMPPQLTVSRSVAALSTPTTVLAEISFPLGISTLVTPADQFYVVSKNFVDPVVDVSTWSLEITGLVDRPFQLSLPELLALPSTSRYVTLECISNVVGGSQISTGRWTGVPFTTLLRRSGIKPTATSVIFTSYDNYTESLPLSQMLDGATMLAHSLDGQLLAAKHGAPARLIALNRYGMKNPKWVHRIELAAQPTVGYWERQGWDAAAVPRTMTRIDVPRTGGAPLGKAVLVGGIAYAGLRGIARVQVSFDAGKSWESASTERALAPSTWVRWAYSWLPGATGPLTILARSGDATGAIQPQTPTWTFPRGADGYASKLVNVS